MRWLELYRCFSAHRECCLLLFLAWGPWGPTLPYLPISRLYLPLFIDNASRLQTSLPLIYRKTGCQGSPGMVPLLHHFPFIRNFSLWFWVTLASLGNPLPSPSIIDSSRYWEHWEASPVTMSFNFWKHTWFGKGNVVSGKFLPHQDWTQFPSVHTHP